MKSLFWDLNSSGCESPAGNAWASHGGSPRDGLWRSVTAGSPIWSFLCLNQLTGSIPCFPDFLRSGSALAAQQAQVANIWRTMKSSSLSGLLPWCVPFHTVSWLQKRPCSSLSWMRQASVSRRLFQFLVGSVRNPAIICITLMPIKDITAVVNVAFTQQSLGARHSA